MHSKAIRGFFLVVVLILTGVSAYAAPYAALVMDARTGEVLHSRNADTRLLLEAVWEGGTAAKPRPEHVGQLDTSPAPPSLSSHEHDRA